MKCCFVLGPLMSNTMSVKRPGVIFILFLNTVRSTSKAISNKKKKKHIKSTQRPGFFSLEKTDGIQGLSTHQKITDLFKQIFMRFCLFIFFSWSLSTNSSAMLISLHCFVYFLNSEALSLNSFCFGDSDSVYESLFGLIQPFLHVDKN